jgi:hypothetical protein
MFRYDKFCQQFQNLALFFVELHRPHRCSGLAYLLSKQTETWEIICTKPDSRLAAPPQYLSSPSPSQLPLFSLHTYLVEVVPLTNGYHCDTSPSLHIEAARIVGFPSGTPSAKFLIASLPCANKLNFSLKWQLRVDF